MVYAELRSRILTGVLLPRERVVASRLAKELGVSEIPVREAIKRLEAEQLVTVIPNSGAVVAPMSLALVRELFDIRSSLEGLAGRTACPHLTPPQFAEMEEHLAAMETTSRTGNFPEASRYNRLFHWVIYRASPYDYLKKLITDLMQRTERGRALFALVPGYYERQISDHHIILALLRAGDAEGVERKMAEHLRYSAERWEAMGRQGGSLMLPGLEEEERVR